MSKETEKLVLYERALKAISEMGRDEESGMAPSMKELAEEVLNGVTDTLDGWEETAVLESWEPGTKMVFGVDCILPEDPKARSMVRRVFENFPMSESCPECDCKQARGDDGER